MPKIIIQPDVNAGSPQPVRLTINGVETPLDVGKEIEVTDEQFVALGHTDHTIEITVEGASAATDTEQAPAPADTSGGDAGGGGASGDATADNSAADPAASGADQASPDAGGDTLDLSAADQLPADATNDPSQPEQTPTPASDAATTDAAAGEQPTADASAQAAADAPADPVAADQSQTETPIEKLQEAVNLEQEAIDELKQGDAQA